MSRALACAAVCRRELLRPVNGAGTSVQVFRNRQLEERCRAIAEEAVGVQGMRKHGIL